MFDDILGPHKEPQESRVDEYLEADDAVEFSARVKKRMELGSGIMGGQSRDPSTSKQKTWETGKKAWNTGISGRKVWHT